MSRGPGFESLTVGRPGYLPPDDPRRRCRRCGRLMRPAVEWRDAADGEPARVQLVTVGRESRPGRQAVARVRYYGYGREGLFCRLACGLVDRRPAVGGELMARKRRRPVWRGLYQPSGSGRFEVRTFRPRKDGQPDRRYAAVVWGWWTPAEAHRTLNDPDKLAGLAADAPLYRAVLDALRRLAQEGS